ncbi:MAG TPA: YkgJ family cysteine cluster protein [Candidatus Angelobacter sp.]|nr:YkgJ family cysteine cluster protein [Candidatus Angelobacter sp.]
MAYKVRQILAAVSLSLFLVAGASAQIKVNQTDSFGKDKNAEAAFEDFANDEPCPALDPATGACDLYAARPMTCRTFGPPVRSGPEEGLAVCELCYHGATDQQIAECEMVPDPDNLEEELIAQAEKQTGKRGNTIVAWCLAGAISK